MIRHACNRTEQGARAGAPPDSTHLRSCEPCRAWTAVHQAMETLAVETPSPRMPSAEVLLVRARLSESRRVAARVSRPLAIFQRIAYAVVTVCWMLFLATQWLPITQWLGGLELDLKAGIEASAALPVSVAWMLAALMLITTSTMIHGMGNDRLTS